MELPDDECDICPYHPVALHRRLDTRISEVKIYDFTYRTGGDEGNVLNAQLLCIRIEHILSLAPPVEPRVGQGDDLAVHDLVE